MKKRLLSFVSIVMIATVVLSGCGAKTNTPGGGGGGGGENSGKGRTDINIPLDSIGATMDVHQSTLRVDSTVTRQMTESLYFIEDDGSVSPRLAESHTVNDDETVYTFKLREGVKFHNGDELKASDVVWNFKRCIDNKYRIEYVEQIVDVKALDDYTVEFTIDAPSSLFVHNASEILIVSEKVVTELGDLYGSVAADSGTGPYRMTKYDMNTEITLEAFPEYWRGEAPIKNIRFVPMTDSSTQLIAFEKGEFDFCQIPTADWDSIESTGKYTTVKAPGLHQSYIGLNVGKKDSPLANEKVRQAIGYAMDKESMVMIAADGFADVADYMIRPGYLLGAVDTGKFYTYDVEKAKALLAEAGYPDGFDLGVIEAISAANGRYVKIAQVLEQNLKDIGITSRIEIGETASMLPAWKTDRAYDIFVSGFTPTLSYYELKGYVYSQADCQVQLNLNDDIDTEFIDSSFDKVSQELDEEKRDQIYSDLDEYLFEVAAYIPVMHVNSLFAWNKDLTAKAPIRYYTIYDWSWN